MKWNYSSFKESEKKEKKPRLLYIHEHKIKNTRNRHSRRCLYIMLVCWLKNVTNPDELARIMADARPFFTIIIQ